MELQNIAIAVEAITPFVKAEGAGDNIEKILDNILTGDYEEALRIAKLMLDLLHKSTLSKRIINPHA